jgi:hypothetical protein
MGDDNGSFGLAPKFPLYLLPSFNIPFRKRRQSAITPAPVEYSSPPREDYFPSLCTSPTDSTRSSLADGPATPSSVSGFSFGKDSRRTSSATAGTHNYSKLSRTRPDTIRCSTCSADLAFTSQIVSKGFTGRYGRAYLVSPPESVMKSRTTAGLLNVKVGKPETRLLVTGSHVVSDIFCDICNTKIGWKYVDAKDESQRYKVGKFILETQRVLDYRSWEDVPLAGTSDSEFEVSPPLRDSEEDPIVFDSEDEDECEDVFSGTWDPEIAAKRRSRKLNLRRQ